MKSFVCLATSCGRLNVCVRTENARQDVENMKNLGFLQNLNSVFMLFFQFGVFFDLPRFVFHVEQKIEKCTAGGIIKNICKEKKEKVEATGTRNGG